LIALRNLLEMPVRHFGVRQHHLGIRATRRGEARIVLCQREERVVRDGDRERVHCLFITSLAHASEAGVLSNVAAERQREIGVRMALGAEAGRVQRMVVAQGTRVVIIGVVIGVAFAIWSTRALGSLLFGVGALDFATFLAMAVAMVLIGMLASYVPARRASNVDPNESLRAN
jgi:predicted lysophospholipase L1 biosynthesis ABC-type transport system permease subunit